ncbi:ganglioside-induced differentiation-associated protein 1 [Periplaneta americana]|uniref:ganglioside-induced differentiation-associated protein 1 n=1 Tax=Periplaneta americana TaxID=6978 RepID=UPI0037E76A4D
MAASAAKEEVGRSSNDNGKGNGLLLYHHHYSFYSQKVIMALHEKKLPFKVHIINLTKGEQYQPWFLRINPRGEVPVLKDGVKVIPDSGRILDYLEDNFSNGDTPRLMPMDQGPEVRQRVLHFRTIIDHIPAGVVTMGSFFHPEFCENPKQPFIQPVRKLLMAADRNSAKTLRMHAEKNPNSRDILLQKAKFQETKHASVTDKEEFKKILNQVDSVLSQVEKELESHIEDRENWWLCSDRFTVADIGLTMLLDRLYRLGLEKYFWEAGKKPHITKYYHKVQQRDSYKKTIPSSLSLVKMFIQTQAPLIIGVMAAVTVIIGGILYYRKNK